jgi:glutathione S-transferase
MAEVVLWHIQVSHYNEKARWALDYKGVPHRRRAPMPGILHPLVGLAKTRSPFLPVLDVDGRSIGDSTRIIGELERRYPEPPLYPVDPDERRRALELEDWFDEEVAPHVRRFLFYELSRDPDRSEQALSLMGAPALRGRAAGVMVRGVARRYGGNAQSLAEARARTLAGYERIAAEAGASGYLVGHSFSVADLTAASILFHLARPPEYQYDIPEFTPDVEEFVETLPPDAVDWIRRIWREHRGTSAEVAA